MEGGGPPHACASCQGRSLRAGGSQALRLGCAKAEDMPGASGTRPTMLGPHLGSRSPGRHWEVHVPCLGGSSILLGMLLSKKHQVSPPQPVSHPLRASLPQQTHFSLLQAIPTVQGLPAGFGLASSIVRRSRRRGAMGRSFIMAL